jgi:hypothetical protein
VTVAHDVVVGEWLLQNVRSLRKLDFDLRDSVHNLIIFFAVLCCSKYFGLPQTASSLSRGPSLLLTLRAWLFPQKGRPVRLFVAFSSIETQAEARSICLYLLSSVSAHVVKHPKQLDLEKREPVNFRRIWLIRAKPSLDPTLAWVMRTGKAWSRRAL